MRLFALAVALAACSPPPRVENPHARHRSTTPDVERDVTLQTAPGGTVQSRDGKPVELASLFANQRTLVIFYMGGWCPHCAKQLGDLNNAQKQFTDRNVKIIGISADAPADIGAMRDKLTLGFDLYSDADLAVISKWGVEDFENHIARPAAFIVEASGEISFRKVGAKAEDRPTVDELLAAVGN
ncbi:MAG: peroxiredoxin family protein [Kofleriaceae bacterium]|nr:peroxiredoxin family protein [Kofleriaceae bacterium]